MRPDANTAAATSGAAGTTGGPAAAAAATATPAIAINDDSYSDNGIHSIAAGALLGLSAAGSVAPSASAAPSTPRPHLTSKLSGLPRKLKLRKSQPQHQIPRISGPSDDTITSDPLGILCVRVIAARNLTGKDKNGKSDPFLHLRIGDARAESAVVKACLNPVWGELEGVSEGSIRLDGRSKEEAIVVGPVWAQTLARTRLECTVWDKDRFAKNEYLGEISLGLEDLLLTSKRIQPIGYESCEPFWKTLSSSRSSKHKVSGEILLRVGWVTPAIASPLTGKGSKGSGDHASAASASNPVKAAYSSAANVAALMAQSSASKYVTQYPIPNHQVDRIRTTIEEVAAALGGQMSDAEDDNASDAGGGQKYSRRRAAVGKVRRLASSSSRSKRGSMASDRVFLAPPSEGVGTLPIGQKRRGGLSNELTDEPAGYPSDSSSPSSEDENEDEEGYLGVSGMSAREDASTSASSEVDEEFAEMELSGEGHDYFDLALGMQDAPKVRVQEPSLGVAFPERADSGESSTSQLAETPMLDAGTAPSTPGAEKKKSKLPIPGFLKRIGSSASIKPGTAPSTDAGPGLQPHVAHQDVPVASGSQNSSNDALLGESSAPPSGATTPGAAYRRKKFTRRKVLIGADDSLETAPLDASGAADDGGKKPKHKRKRKHATTGRRRKMSHPSITGKGGYSLSTGTLGDDQYGVVFIEVKGASNLPKWRNMTRTGWDMDPFCIISFGQKIFRTRVVRHSRNPVWDEKLFFHVKRHEHAYQIQFNLFDWDKMSSNDFVGECPLLLSELTEKAPKPDESTGIYPVNKDGKVIGDDLHDFTLTLGSKSAELEDQAKNPSSLTIRAKFTPYSALRQRFWRTYLSQYDTDDSGTWTYVELYSVLDSLGSTLTRDTIESFFTRFGKTSEEELTAEQVIICLEDQLSIPLREKRPVDARQEGSGSASMASGLATPNAEAPGLLSLAENGEGAGMSFTGLPLTGEPASGVPPKDTLAAGSGTLAPQASSTSSSSSNGSGASKREGGPAPPRRASSTQSLAPFSQPARHDSLMSETSDAGGAGASTELEMLINIKTCPLCHKKLSKKAEVDMVSHLAVCASQDWSSLSSLTVANFVSTSQAHRKWFTKLVNKVSNGSYRLGADSANILVQNRMTGQLEEEKMQVYVRVGIRLWYRAAGSKSRMEATRIRNLLTSMTIKQGAKFNAPESVAEIPRFIAFHQLNVKEVLDPVDSFPHFNAFFYRKLKPDARPLADPDDPTTLVSGADCRMTAFQTVTDATQLWIKGKTFSIKRLLGGDEAEAKRYEGGSLCIFRLAPQDYHRYHSSVDGTIGKMNRISGEWYTVNPLAIRSHLDVYCENQRVVVPMDSPVFGKVMNVCIGAMMVGSINFTKRDGEDIKRGEEFGYYAFGGSTNILLFEPNTVKFDQDILDNSNACVETLVRVGMRIGKRI